MTPNTRLEKWLAKIAGESVDIQPKDRLETLLAKIAGDDVSITPDDSLEYWLNQIAENGGGGGTQTITIVSEQSITAETPAQGLTNAYVTSCEVEEMPTAPPSSITVTFDGTDYVFTEYDDFLGAAIPPGSDTVDFSVYPFAVGLGGDPVGVLVGDQNAHTIGVSGVIQAIVPEGDLYVSENGYYDCAQYANVDVYVEQFTPTGTITINQNGTHDVTNYASASVNVPQPSGTIAITTNGTHDVSSYASANVSVGAPYGTKTITIRNDRSDTIRVSGCINGTLFTISGGNSITIDVPLTAPDDDGRQMFYVVIKTSAAMTSVEADKLCKFTLSPSSPFVREDANAYNVAFCYFSCKGINGQFSVDTISITAATDS